MSKQNRSISPPLKHDAKNRSRRADAVLRKCKRSNAQKHGVFARPLIIPGENLSEFQELYDELIAEWNPAGPTLRDALFDLADTKWRKRRLKKYIQTELFLNTFDPCHPAFNEVWGLIMFIDYLGSDPEKCFDEHAKKYLRVDKINYLEQKFPHTKSQSISEWAQAITTEIWSVLLPAIPGFKPAESGAETVVEQAAREWRTEQQVAGSIRHARELLEYEFNQTERLEARIFKQTRQCAELKAWEEMRSKT